MGCVSSKPARAPLATDGKFETEIKVINAPITASEPVQQELDIPHQPSDVLEARQLSRLFYNEEDRCSSMMSCGVYNANPEPRFNNITNLMSTIFQVPLAVINLFGKDECIFKGQSDSAKGFTDTFGCVFERDTSVCDAIMVPDNPEVLVVNDMLKDARFASNPWVANSPTPVRFYAGAPLVGSDGYRYGTLCVSDLKPRSFPVGLYNTLLNFAELVVRELERDRSLDSMRKSYDISKALRNPQAHKQPVAFLEFTGANTWKVLYVNDAWCDATGLSTEACTSQTLWDMYSPLNDVFQHNLIERAVADSNPLCLQVVPAKQQGSSKKDHHHQQQQQQREELGRLSLDERQTLIAAAMNVAANAGGATAAQVPKTMDGGSLNGQAGDGYEEVEPVRSSATSVLQRPLHPRDSIDTDITEISGLAAGGVFGGVGVGGGLHSNSSSFNSDNLQATSTTAATTVANTIQAQMQAQYNQRLQEQQQQQQSIKVLTLRPADIGVLESRVPVGIPNVVRSSIDSTRSSMDGYSSNRRAKLLWFATLEDVSPLEDPQFEKQQHQQGTKPVQNQQKPLSKSHSGSARPTAAQFLMSQQPAIPDNFALRISTSSTVSSSGGIVLPEALQGGSAEEAAHCSPALLAIKLGSLLGSGGFGRVYRGQWNGILVAVKVLDPVVVSTLDGLSLNNCHSFTPPVSLGSLYGPYSPSTTPNNNTGNSMSSSSKVSGTGTGEKDSRPPVLEAVLTKALDHPNIVKTLDYGHRPMDSFHSFSSGFNPYPQFSSSSSSYPTENEDEPSTLWIVQQYCNHGRLNDAYERGWLRAEPILSSVPNLRWVLLTAVEISDALRYLHSNGIIHGDLNGNNVLLTSSTKDERGFTAMVGDFGLATVLGTNTEHQTKSVGTVSHMPPELFSQGIQSKAGDVYAMGVILWEMYCGMRAWLGKHPAEIILKVSTGQVAAGLQLPIGTPPAFKELVERCLAVEYQQRPNFEEIHSHLSSMLQGLQA